MSDVAIRCEGLSKRYQIGSRESNQSLRDSLTDMMYAPVRRLLSLAGLSEGEPNGHKTIWALKDVSFEVKRGEAFGIIGRNGAGKSTLLKILSRITKPTEGCAEIHGRVGSLLEVGTGFHPELTGRENIYLNGAILGMKKAEMNRKFDEIVDFAEVDQFIDTPVKRYSSGMYMRLAFAVAAHLEPEILLVDEVLAVGDVAFQKKCLGKMGDVTREGRTVFFVSHNLQAVQSLCDQSLFLLNGGVASVGSMEDVVEHYLNYLQARATKSLEENPDREGDGPVRLKSAYTCDEQGVARKDFVAGEPLTFNFEYVRSGRCKAVGLSFTIFNQFNVACTRIDTSYVNFDLDALSERGHIVCRIARNPLPIGEYRVTIRVEANGEVADRIPKCLSFRVVASKFFPSAHVPNIRYCPVMVDHKWQHNILTDSQVVIDK